MLNSYEQLDEDIIAIKVDGSNKYNINVLIDKNKLSIVDKNTTGYWRLLKINDKYKVFTIYNGKIIYLDEILTKDNNNDFIFCNNDYDYSYYLSSIKSVLDYCSIDDCTLKDIINSNDEINKIDILNTFKSVLLGIKQDRLSKKYFKDVDKYLQAIDLYDKNKLTGKDLEGLDSKVEELQYLQDEIEFNHKSKYLLNGDLIIVYPIIKELICNKECLCELSGLPIHKGNMYYNCKLFIEDITNHSIYCTNNIKVSEDYIDYFPTNITDIDEFFYKVDNSYNVDDEVYYNISSNLKHGHFGLKLIKNKKR